MAPSKKKHSGVRVLDNVTFPRRRSSLRVNLSYISNLSDSGNGSLRNMHLENDDPGQTRRAINIHRDLLPNISENAILTVDLKDPQPSTMSDKERILNQSCQLLKDAIMNKTEEIFDRRTELAIKTASILKGQRQALKEINHDSTTGKSAEIVLSRNSMTHNGTLKDRPIAQDSKFALPKILKPFSRISKDESIILSGSNVSHRNLLPKTTEKVLRVSLTKITDPRLETSMESSQSSISDIGAPITCSSFRSGILDPNSQQAESERCSSIENSDVEEPLGAIELQGSLTQMGITAVPGHFPLMSKRSEKQETFSEVTATLNIPLDNQSSVVPVPMEFTPVQNHIPLRNWSKNNNTTSTSLDVNTSVDVLSRMSQIGNSRRVLTRSKIDNPQDNEITQISMRVNTSLGIKDLSPEQESRIDGKRSKLLISKELRKSEDRGSDEDPIENMSLIQKLRNISAKNSTSSHRVSTSDGPSFIEGTPYPPSRSILWKTQIMSEITKNRTTLKSNFLKRTPTKLTISSDSDSTASHEYLSPQNGAEVSQGDSPCRIKCITSNPRIIEDSSESEELPEEKSTSTISKSKPTSNNCTKTNLRITNTSLEENESIEETDANVVPKQHTTSNIQKTRKRKLLPLHEHHEIASFSPVSETVLTPQNPISWKPQKQFRKKKSIRAVAAKRIEALRTADEDDEDLVDCSGVESTKTQKVKAKSKKPRKVISKKIIVKKIAGNDLMDEFEEIGRKSSDLTGERNSINEFSKKKRLSIAGRVFNKLQKLVIVVTGFSKGDAGLVKSIAKELGNAEVNSTVSRRTTHVVSTGVRTINLLRGIIRGCWMVTLDWVLKSLENHKWLSADKYEMVHFSKAVQENRRDRQMFGKAYVPELFATCGPIYIERKTSPPPEILKELIKTAGGRIAENPRDSKLSIGLHGLREIWILDSITTGDLQPIAEYQWK